MSKESPDGVVVSWVRPSQVHGLFMENMLNLAYYDRALHDRMGPGRGGFTSQASSANISGARNSLCLEFLTNHSAPWLLMLDTDMTFQHDIVEALLEFADEEKAPIVGGLCFSMDDGGKLFPTLYDLIGDADSPEFVRYHEWKPESMMQVFATGAACLLIHRNALRAIRDYRDPKLPGQVGFSQAFPWFQETDFYGRAMGEDITFCMRAGLARIPVHVNTAVQLGHIKEFELNIEHFAGQRALEEAKAATGDGERRSVSFDEWSELNGVVGDFRSRFDVLREYLPTCTTRAQAQALVASEGFGERYPELPEWLA